MYLIVIFMLISRVAARCKHIPDSQCGHPGRAAAGAPWAASGAARGGAGAGAGARAAAAPPARRPPAASSAAAPGCAAAARRAATLEYNHLNIYKVVSIIN